MYYNNDSPKSTTHQKPCKDLLESFLASDNSFHLPEIPLKTRKKGIMRLNCEFSSVYRYMFYVMYRNRYKPACEHQEVCHLSYRTIAHYSRVTLDMVKQAICYGKETGFLTQLTFHKRKKNMFAPGHLFTNTYSQISSTEEKLGAQCALS